MNLLVDGCMVIELKSVEKLAPVHVTYLRLLNLSVGLLINFGAATFKEGIRRVVNKHQDFASSRLRVSQKIGGMRSREGRELLDVIIGDQFPREGARPRRETRR